MAEAIVSIVVGRLTDLLTEEATLLHEVRDDIQQVVTELMRMKTFLPDADSRIDEEKIRNFLAEVREEAYDAEHVVETFILKASSTERNRRKLATKMEEVQKKMSLLSNLFHEYNIKSTLELLESSNSSYGTPGMLKRFYSFTTVEPDIFVGFHGDVETLIGHLLNENDDCYPLISICGMGGLGKTTIAQKIFNHPRIKSNFAGLAWVSISQKWQAESVLLRILICLIPEKKDDILKMDADKLVQNLLQIQEKKKCLIVLDDIWTPETWDSLKAAFRTEISVNKLILTSRKVKVAEHVNPKGLIHQPDLLDAEQSWELLQLKALPVIGGYQDISRDYKRMEELGREMLKKCSGLPLAIVILGGILVTKPSLLEWEKVYHDSLSSLKRGRGLGEDHQREVFDVLRWSYNDLPSQLKPCFLYFGKFGEDEILEIETLYQLWIAEGLVLSSDRKEGETMMQVAESYMGELVHKSMVQVKFNNDESFLLKFESCSLHDLMRDLSLWQAKAEAFFDDVDFREGNTIPFVEFRMARQVVVYFGDEYKSRKANSYFVKNDKQQRYRSVILMNWFATLSLPPLVGSHVANFRFLRVFSLEEIHFDRQTVFAALSQINLGRVLGSLIYLRYLNVRNTNLLIFPSIQKLVLLQTLKLDVARVIYFPPWLSKNILGNLKRLMHLCLPYGDVRNLGKNFKLRFDGLSKLETLERFNTSWCEIKDLPKLISLQELSLEVEGGYYEVEEMMKYLAALAFSSSSCLRLLALSLSISGQGLRNGPDILRQLLWDHDFHLKNLSIDGKLPELALLLEQQQLHVNTKIDVLLIRITYLALSESLLEEDPMPILENIPMLSHLFLCDSAYIGKEMVCSAAGFPKLTRLQLQNLPNFESWKVEEGSISVLSFLFIYKCYKLEELPEGLRFLNALRELVLQNMPSDFCDRVRIVNGEEGPDFYKVSHIPSIDILDIE